MSKRLGIGLGAAAAAAAGLLVVLTIVPAQEPRDARPDRIGIAYVPPSDPEHRRLHNLLAARQVLENFREYLGAFRLPRSLTLKLDECGHANAWYEPWGRTIKVCYEYIAEVVRNAPQAPTAAGVTREDAIVGPVIEVFLHEIAHALFDILKIPILGREEDAADQIAAYLLLQLSKQEARGAVAGTAYMYFTEAQAAAAEGGATAPDPRHFSGVHGSPAQRFQNLLCIAYGADPVLFADAVGKGFLPRERADGCGDEYEQVAHAFRTLIEPHREPERARALQGRPWLRFELEPAASGAAASGTSQPSQE